MAGPGGSAGVMGWDIPVPAAEGAEQLLKPAQLKADAQGRAHLLSCRLLLSPPLLDFQVPLWLSDASGLGPRQTLEGSCKVRSTRLVCVAGVFVFKEPFFPSSQGQGMS